MVDSLEQLGDLDRLTIITGDLNICMDKQPNNVIAKFLCDQGFHQLVTSPTHVAGGRIDHAYLRDPETQLVGSHLTQFSPYYSDHDALCLTLTTKVDLYYETKYLGLMNPLYRSVHPSSEDI